MADDKTFPDPLTPADCDLRGLQFMPLDVIRLMDSDLFALSSGDEFKAAVALWCKSWTQIPAASLPNDDRVLAHLSGTGTRWKKVKALALRGWVRCNDGRLYHPVVAEKAIEALPMRKEYKDKKTSEAARKAKERTDRKELFELLHSHGIVPEFTTSTRQLRDMASRLSQGDMSHSVTDSERDMSQPVTAKTGTGTGTGTVTPKPPSPVTSEAIGLADELFEISGIDPVKQVNPNWHRQQSDLCAGWLKLRPRAEIVEAVRQTVDVMRAKDPGWTCATLKFFDGWVRNPKPQKPLTDAEQAALKARQIARERGIPEAWITDPGERRWVLALDATLHMEQPTLRHWDVLPPWEPGSTCPKAIATAFPDAIERLKAAAAAGVVIA